jgi:ABC-type transport system substrate-binding protein
LTRFDDYHDTPAPIKDAEFSVFGDRSGSLLAFEAGEIDYTLVPSADVNRIAGNDKYTMHFIGGPSTIFMFMNTEKAPFDNALVRQAFNYAVNKDDILYAAVNDLGEVVGTIPAPEYTYGVPAKGEIFDYTYDPEKAKALLSEAGYPDGLTLPEPIFTFSADDMYTVPVEVIQQQLADIGVTAEIQLADAASYAVDAISGNIAFGLLSVGLPADASSYALLFTTAGIDALNLSRYSNARVDELFALASSTMDDNERKTYFKDAYDIITKDAAYIPLFSPSWPYAGVKDLNANPSTTFYSWSWING